MADFNYYLNRQGVRGRKGDKGEQGFSPVITEYDTGNPLEYVLRIQTEDGVMYTQNLRPEFVNNGGTYLRFNQSNNVFSIGTADYATTSSQGEVRLANSGDVTALTSTTTVVTPKDIDTILTNKGYTTSISNINNSILTINSEITNNINPSINTLTNNLNSLDQNTVKKTDKATTSSLGIVKVDGTTITIDSNGTIHGASTYILPTASTSTLGGVKIDGTTITIDANGVISSTGTSYIAGRGINITNGAISISNIVVDTSSNQNIYGEKDFHDGCLFYKLESDAIKQSGGEANWLSYDGAGGVTLGKPDYNHITIPRNNEDYIRITRSGSTYTNIDSGNISADAYIASLVSRIAALETQINGGNA